jgi:hypothetical protein
MQHQQYNQSQLLNLRVNPNKFLRLILLIPLLITLPSLLWIQYQLPTNPSLLLLLLLVLLLLMVLLLLPILVVLLLLMLPALRPQLLLQLKPSLLLPSWPAKKVLMLN